MDRKLSIFEALNLLGPLETLTRDSLPKPPPLPVPKAVLQPMPLPASLPPLDPTQFETSKDEYKPALQDQSLIEALLQFHKDSRKAEVKKAAEAPAPKPVQEQGFRASLMEGVLANPKPTRHFRRSTGIYQSILRPTEPFRK
ncbi:MAG TPA: hypothetical protein DCS07_17190 [Bdellovibrionales bacterium]|nr:MAG: hypothetical protein A2Z97_11985 [Bdellovibrionales bacterium GWB1_52_6]OFZ06048.1 MAG: hypothetical protein A2X97_01790 [Bdellovibrionales bacterium GWA1_52_35]OFZ37070.1 MAG: hypothetical protein A2070_11090 [Bdellovibrionales bacterium GWC1_52_8]HAR44337.1 hypothetical protein [Bdellovibrionales bacterium]HCM39327.1 hypothetical protein [Bdellovibrionales bacterium]